MTGYQNLIGIIVVAAVAGVFVGTQFGVLVGYLLFHNIVAAFLIANSESRGLVPDILFGLLWPIHLIDDWKNDRL